MSGDLTCDHGTLLAAWCGECSLEWTEQSVEPTTTQRGQNAA